MKAARIPKWNFDDSKTSHKETSDSDSNEVDNLLQEIRQLEQLVQEIGIPELKERIHKLHEAVKKLLRKNAEQSLEKRKKINELNLRVQRLELDVKRLESKVENLTSITVKLTADNTKLTADNTKLTANRDILEIAQVTWFWESHLARFVLPKEEKLGRYGHFDQMQEYLNEMDDKTPDAFAKIQDRCGGKWTEDHRKAVKFLKHVRFPIAHPRKIDFIKALKQIEEVLPRRKKECQYMITMLKKVDSLMKFGILAAEFQQDEKRTQRVVKRLSRDLTEEKKWTKMHDEALSEMANWKQPFAEDLQDIEPDEAESHVVGYVTNEFEKKCAEIIQIIKKLNSWKFGQLARNYEKNIVQYVLDDDTRAEPAIEEMNKRFEEDTEGNESAAKKRWNELTKTKWSKEHNEALHKLKSLDDDCTDDLTERDFKFGTARLHVVDFLDGNLRKQGFEILDIFELFDKIYYSG